MSKLNAFLVGFVVLCVAISSVQGDVIPAAGMSEGHLKDLSSHFITPPTGGPVGSGGPAPVPAVLPNVGDELRSIYRLDDLQLVGGGTYWNKVMTTGDEVTGLLYDLQVSRLVDMNSDGIVDRIYYTGAGRNPLTAGDDKNGDIGNFPGQWGGVIELYQDPSPDLDAALNGGAGPGLWSPAGGPLRPNGVTNADGYPSASDGTLWISGVLLDLSVFGDTVAFPGEVYCLTRITDALYAGVGFLNIFDGSAAAYIQAGAQPLVGVGQGKADVTLAFTVSLNQNVWLNPNWQAGSSDPVRFSGQEIPEPCTLLLVGLGVGLLGARRRRDQ